MSEYGWWAITSNMGWGESKVSPNKALLAALKGGGNRRPREAKGMVFELVNTVTHIDQMNGHALHRPEGAQPTAMGNYPAEYQPYKRGPDNKVIEPRYFKYKYGKGWREYSKEEANA